MAPLLTLIKICSSHVDAGHDITACLPLLLQSEEATGGDPEYGAAVQENAYDVPLQGTVTMDGGMVRALLVDFL